MGNLQKLRWLEVTKAVPKMLKKGKIVLGNNHRSVLKGKTFETLTPKEKDDLLKILLLKEDLIKGG